MTDMVVAPQQQPTAMARQGFGTQELVRQNETAGAMVAAQAQALVQARYIVARQNPRDLDVVRVDILKECKRPRFAEKAKWRRPVGDGKIGEGPSIRLAEVGARCMGNIDSDVVTIYDDTLKRLNRIIVTDLEKSVTYTKDVTIDKTVERSKLKEGQIPLGRRLNSQGREVFIVEADEGALHTKENAIISKQLRTLLLRVIPGDLIDEAMDVAMETLRSADKADPEAAKKKLVDAFVDIGVSPEKLKAYLGHDLAELNSWERDSLRAIFTAIKDGETSWSEVVAAKKETVAPDVAQPPAGASEKTASEAQTTTKSRTSSIKDKLKKESAAAKPTEPVAEPVKTPTVDESEEDRIYSEMSRALDRMKPAEADIEVSAATGGKFQSRASLTDAPTATWKAVIRHLAIITDEEPETDSEDGGK